MKITNAALKYRITILVLMVLLLLGGLWSYIAIPKEATPSIEIPIVTVSAIFPGASPREVETLLTFPIEQELQGIEGVDEIRSTSREGLSFIFVEFITGTDLADATQRVRDRVDQARPELPEEADQPLVREFNIEDIPIINVNLVAPYPLAQLTNVAEQLQDMIEALPGVIEAQLTGGVTREVQILVNLTALDGYGLTFDDVARTIEQEHVSIPGGTIDVDQHDYQIRVDGRFDDAAIISDLVIQAPDQRPVYIRDVAEVIPLGFADRTSFSRLRQLSHAADNSEALAENPTNYQETVSLAVRARTGENVIELTNDVRRAVDQFNFPSGTEVIYTNDRSEQTRQLVDEMENHIILGMLLVTLSLLFFLGISTALLAAISIPLTMMITFVIFFAMGETLNFIVLFSLIVVLGILVDFSIVVVENIQVQYERGLKPLEAARAAANEVGWPVTAGLTTTAVVFVPLLFWTGIVGEYMWYLPLTLIITLTSALLVAIVMVPVAANYILPSDEPKLSMKWPRRIGLGALAFILLILLLANPTSVAALFLLCLAIYLLYRFVLKPGTSRFRNNILPASESHYRVFLTHALKRDYSVKWAFLRNTGALISFVAGVVLLIIGAVIFATLGLTPAYPALIPGGILAAVGALWVIIHCLEILFLGRHYSVYTGLIIGLVLLPFILIYLFDGILALNMLLIIIFLPAVMILTGFTGMIFSKKNRKLILTDNRAGVLNAITGAFLTVGVLFFLADLGASFMPDTDPSQIRISMEMAPGTKVEASNRAAEQAIMRIEELMEREPKTQKSIENILVNVAVTGTGPFAGMQPDPRRVRITLSMVDFQLREESSRETLQKVRDIMDDFPGAIITVEGDEMGPPTDPPFVLEVTGPEFDTVAEIIMEAELRIREATGDTRIQGLVDLRNTVELGSPELRVNVDRERTSLFGLSTAAVATTLQAAVEGLVVGIFREADDEYDIRVRLREEDRQTLESLEALSIRTEEARIPLLSVADLVLETGPGTITRVDLNPIATLQGDVQTSFTAGEVVEQTRDVLAGLLDEMPADYSLRFAGELEEQEEAFDFLAIALIIGIGLMAIVLISKFNRLSVIFIIISAVILTMSGVIMGMIATQSAFSLMTFLAIVSLAGIVADDDIVLSEFILRRMKKGESVNKAIIEGSASRFRQVTLTAVTTIIGLVPLTFGFHFDFQGLFTELQPNFQVGSENSQFWGPLGAAVIAGLPVATVVTLLVVPVLYSVVNSVQNRGRAILKLDNSTTRH